MFSQRFKNRFDIVYFQCEVSLQSANERSVQQNENNDVANNNNYYHNHSGDNLSTLSVAHVHVTTVLPLLRDTSTSSTSSSSEAEFDVVINQSHYELHQPPQTSRDVIVYVMQLVRIARNFSNVTLQIKHV